jgi:hypothetical protein
MSIEPDSRDWTWVLERVCPECGVDVRSFPREQVGDLVRRTAVTWIELLGHSDATTRTRPDRWSTLEYACHVRDVFRVYDVRLARMTAEDGPHYDNWDQDATAIEDHYADQDRAAVAAELGASGERIAARFDSVSGDAWQRTGFRGDGAEFTIERLARYFLHDVLHHLHDVGAVIELPRP